MKKMALSIAVSTVVAASGASAATILEQDNLKLDLEGDFQVNFEKSTVKDSKVQMVYDDMEVKFKPTYSFDNGLTAFGVLEVEFKDDADRAPLSAGGVEVDVPSNKVDDAYVGLGYMGGTIAFGDMVYASDDFGIGEDFELGVDGAGLGSTDGADVIKVTYGTDMFTVKASYDMPEEDMSGLKDERSFDLYGETTFSDITVAGTFQSYKKQGKGADDVNSFGISGKYATDMFSVGAEFTSVDEENAEAVAYEIAGTYSATDMVTLAAGFGQWIPDEGDTVSQYYLNAKYAFAEKAYTFAEIGGNDVDDSELGYAVGLAVKF
ncbi:porin [Gynuella sp.]|uniref:porin n=1 Tax=Gynuella sp. TaxID=2969146 RepID=UPI003D11068B